MRDDWEAYKERLDWEAWEDEFRANTVAAQLSAQVAAARVKVQNKATFTGTGFRWESRTLPEAPPRSDNVNEWTGLEEDL